MSANDRAATVGSEAVDSTFSSVRYRGGFSTSLCDLFSNPSRRSDCCAITCCGLFVSDRTHHLLNISDTPWWETWVKRLCVNCMFPAVAMLVATIMIAPLYYADQDPATNDEGAGDSQDTVFAAVSLVYLVIMIAIPCGLIIRGQNHRIRLRRAVMEKMRNATISDQGGDDSVSWGDDAPSSTHMDGGYLATVAPHATFPCACCLVVDNLPEGGLNTENYEDQHPRDACSVLWSWVACLCCKASCIKWCQCCGMCAVGQEDREIQRLMPKSALLIDYVTFQPFADYYSKILAVRKAQDGSALSHLRSMSALSTIMLKALGVAFLIISVASLLISSPQSILVAAATFFQAFILLYLVHWRNHRFVLSFDAVVKFFSSGFVLGIVIALFYETLVQFLLVIGAYVLAFVGLIAFGIYSAITESNVPLDTNAPSPSPTGDNDLGSSSELFFNIGDYVPEGIATVLMGVGMFAMAFIVAALVEELTKYFCFWMVEHPDFLPEGSLTGSPVDIDYNTSSDITTAAAQPKPKNSHNSLQADESDIVVNSGIPVGELDSRTLSNKAAAITIAMVSAALGFACCENFLYVFEYGPGGILNEFSTLAARSLFPIHPLCAAIQSISVVERDVVGDKSVGLGKILFPAILLHGSFDFVLMFISGLGFINKTYSDDYDESESENEEAVLSFSFGIVITLMGIIYYFRQFRAQRARLKNLDDLKQQGGSILLVPQLGPIL